MNLTKTELDVAVMLLVWGGLSLPFAGMLGLVSSWLVGMGINMAIGAGYVWKRNQTSNSAH